MKRALVLAIAASALLAACGEEAGAPSATAAGTSTAATTSSTVPASCSYYDIAGCALYGLVLVEPLPTAEALAAVADLPGVPIALWRTDPACVLAITMLPPGSPGYGALTASRFAYVDAEGIRERRLATSGSVAPPITGMHISQSYWDHWEDQWAQAQEPPVLVEAVAVYLPVEVAGALAADERFSAVVPVPWRRTDTVDPSYTGELLVESEDFPAGYLSEPPTIGCG